MSNVHQYYDTALGKSFEAILFAGGSESAVEVMQFLDQYQIESGHFETREGTPEHLTIALGPGRTAIMVSGWYAIMGLSGQTAMVMREDEFKSRYGDVVNQYYDAIGIPFNSPEENDPDQFFNKAKRLVARHSHKHLNDEISPSEVYVVWFSKTLQNWKAMCSTAKSDGRYYEVTYNGDKKEAYVDCYVKQLNEVVPD